MKVLYTVIVAGYFGLIKIASLFNAKAKLWISGRKQQANSYGSISFDQPPIWFHCSSLGEFEQARPVIERIHEGGQEKILLTFFSPSGYEIRKNYQHADWVMYLPADLPKSVDSWLEMTNPKLLILTKYDFWWNHLGGCHQRKIPVILISAVFRNEQYFFKKWAVFFRINMHKFHHIFAQDSDSYELLMANGFRSKQLSISGDTRVDCVTQHAKEEKHLTKVADFVGDRRTIVVGSSWPEEEALVHKYLLQFPMTNNKFIIAPHDVSKANIERLRKKFDGNCTLWSDPSNMGASVLIVDTIGLLASIYRYAWIAVIGGGFGKGIHNILEPMAYSKPLLFGNNFAKFREAVCMVETGGAKSINSYLEFEAGLQYFEVEMNYTKAKESIEKFISENQGASQDIFQYLRTNKFIQ